MRWTWILAAVAVVATGCGGSSSGSGGSCTAGESWPGTYEVTLSPRTGACGDSGPATQVVTVVAGDSYVSPLGSLTCELIRKERREAECTQVVEMVCRADSGERAEATRVLTQTGDRLLGLMTITVADASGQSCTETYDLDYRRL